MDEITFVKPLGGERPREVYFAPAERSNTGLIITIGIAAVLFAGLIAGLVSFAFNRSNELAKVSPTPVAPTPAEATPTPTPKPSATKFVQIEPANANVSGDGVPLDPLPKTAPPEDATALCTDGTYTKWVHTKKACSANGGVAKWYVSGIDNSRKARAICGDGHISYFDGPRFLVCATGGGVRHWYY
ncbi:MAG: DUF3761 domain-containing protein [Pyrinomonadaceae bacterium]